MRLKHLLPAIVLAFATLPASALTLKIATISPDGTSWMRTMRAAGAEIAERTANRVKLRFYPGGVMGNDKSVMRKIRVGQLHGGAVTGGSLADLLPDANVYGLPFLFRNRDEVDKVRAKIDPIIIQRLEDKGIISFGFAEGGFSYFFSHQPIQTLEQLRQRRIWAPEGDKVSETAFAALKISPVSLPLTDVLTGLQTGLIDTVMSSPTGAIGLQWHTQVQYATDLPLTYIYGTLMIAKKPLDRLIPADRAIVAEVLRKAFKQLDKKSREDNAGARRALAAQGIQFVAPDDSQRDAWEKVIDRAVRKLGNDGYFSEGFVKQVMDLVKTIRQAP